RTAIPLSRALLDAARDECDLATAEGRARMLAQARPLWSTLPDGGLRGQILVELAALGGLPPGQLADLWSRRGGAGFRGGEPRRAEGRAQGAAPDGYPRDGRSWRERGAGNRGPAFRSAPKTPEDRMVQMLFGQPDFWERLSSDEHVLLHGLPGPHGALVG